MPKAPWRRRERLSRFRAISNWQEAAATWMAFATTWAGLIDIGRLSAGQTVLITAASASTGLAAVQVARKVGATPVALTRTSAKAAALLDAGAAPVVATEEQDLALAVGQITGRKGAELVFDAVGGPNFEKLVNATSVGGLLIVYGRFSREVTPLPVAQILFKDLTIRGFGLPSTIARDDKLAAVKQFVSEGIASGALRPVIARTFRLDDIVNAHRYPESATQFGKVVVTV
jgi:NADPH:quinone reductase-like Zn-dependent oxidoreductase